MTSQKIDGADSLELASESFDAPLPAAANQFQSGASKYGHLSREQLMRLLERRDASRKFGLVWERPEADLEAALNDDYVALDLVTELCEGTGPYPHQIIEGDNYDALRILRATHAGRVKVIIIDPPYNTGAQDFVFNDRYVDRDHRFRHSLWLEFMYQRLRIARELLRPDGVIFVNIGEDEFAHLSMLMDQVFAGMKVGTFVWRTRQGANDSSGAFFSQDHEYVLCYAGPDFAFGGHEKTLNLYKNPDSDPRGAWKSADITKAHTYLQRPNAYYPIQDPATGVWYPCNPDSVWRFASTERLKPGQKLRARPMEDLIADGRILFPKNDKVVSYATRVQLDEAIAAGTAPFVLREGLPDLEFWVGRPIGYGRPQGKRFLSDMKRSTKPLSSWIVATLADKIEKEAAAEGVEALVVGTNTEGTGAIQRILGGKVFNFPKPVSLVKALLGQSTESSGSDIILDFFAGSGTTAQAVLELNDEDEGDRRFILVSSTESTQDDPTRNVCRDITRLRVSRVMSGYSVRLKGRKSAQSVEPKAVEGLGGSFAYLRAVRVPMAAVRAQLTHTWVWTALQMLHAGVVGEIDTHKPFFVLQREEGDVYYMPNVTDADVDALRQRLAARPSAVVYSWRPGILRQRCDFDGVVFEKIPEALVERFGAALEQRRGAAGEA